MESKTGFNITYAFASIVPPLKGIEESQEKVESKIFDESEPGFNFLIKIFDNVSTSCKIGINFISDDNQNNPIRSLVTSIVQDDTLDEKFIKSNGLAENLAKVTDARNKTGLFVILVGNKLTTYRVVLLRFRAEEVVYKKTVNGGFKIDMIKQAYSQNTNLYKVAYYEDMKAKSGNFWKGFILDRQKKSTDKNRVSEYWIKEFLQSQYDMTDYQGTIRLSDYIKSFARNLKEVDDQEIVIESVQNLRNNLDQDNISIIDYANNYLPINVRDKFIDFVGDSQLNNTYFNIDLDTYNHELPFKVLNLDNGISLTVPTFLETSILSITDLNNGVKEFSFRGKLEKTKFTTRPN